MSTASNQQMKGRKKNAAQPLGEQSGLVSKEGTEKTGQKSRRAAGPDGPDAAKVGATFKRKPAS